MTCCGIVDTLSLLVKQCLEKKYPIKNVIYNDKQTYSQIIDSGEYLLNSGISASGGIYKKEFTETKQRILTVSLIDDIMSKRYITNRLHISKEYISKICWTRED